MTDKAAPSETAADKSAAPDKVVAKPRKGAAKKGGKVKSKKKRPAGLAVFTEAKTVPGWVTAARCVMILAFAAAIPTVLGLEQGRRLFWSAAIAVLPLVWVVGGYSLWRRICPLAVFAQLGRLLGFAGNRRVKGWLADNYMLLQLGLMIIALSLRLIMTNGTPWALAGFLGVATACAVVLSFIYTGKTWCNYVCPVGMVEKFYTEPIQLVGNQNSQCSPCTACKKNCPDIDLEQGYWKELTQSARRTAYFAWPGIVFGFYFYFYLIAGNWDFYFSGAWTLDDLQANHWLGPGLYFFESIPVVAAAPLTLIVFGIVSAGLFALIEKIMLARAKKNASEREKPRELVRHRMLALTGFIAFIIFYLYGGQPTIRRLPPWFGTGFSILVVVAASAIFFRRWARRQIDFVHERFAQKILKRWEWGDDPPSDRLQDIYLLHNERTKERKNRLQAYKETVREMVADGLVSSNELVLLDSLRAQLGISDKDHKKILAELSEEERQLFDPEYQGSIELRVQQQQYERELESYAISAARAGDPLDPTDLESLRAKHNLAEDEHAGALGRVLSAEGPVFAIFELEVNEIRKLADGYLAALGDGASSSASYGLLRYLCRRRAGQRLERALNIMVPLGDADTIEQLRGKLLPIWRPTEADAFDVVRGVVGDSLSSKISTALSDLLRDEPGEDAPRPPEPFVELASDGSSYVRAAVVHIMTRFDDDASKQAVYAATDDDEPLVREAAYHALGVRGRLKRKLMSKALADVDDRVRRAAVHSMGRSGKTLDTDAAIAQADAASTQGVYATLDADARMESLTTLEKMMFLRNVPMFETLDPDDLEEATLIAEERYFKPGEDLCVEGEQGDDVYLIVAGSVEAWTGDRDSKRVLGESGPGSCIGEMAVFDSSKRSATVTATAPTRTLVLLGDDFKSLMLARPAIGQSIIGVLVRRLRGMISG